MTLFLFACVPSPQKKDYYLIDGEFYKFEKPLTEDEAKTDIKNKIKENPNYNYERKYKEFISEDTLEQIKRFSFQNYVDNKKNGDLVDFHIVKFIEKNNTQELYFSLTYSARTWLFIEIVDLYIDGKKTNLVIGKAKEDVNYGITEKFLFPANLAQIKAIVNAKEVTIRLHGKDYYFDAIFDEQNFYNFKRFYEEHLK